MGEIVCAFMFVFVLALVSLLLKRRDGSEEPSSGFNKKKKPAPRTLVLPQNLSLATLGRASSRGRRNGSKVSCSCGL